MHTSWKSYHHHTSKTKPFSQDFDNKVATEQLAAVVDGTLMPHNFPEIS